MNGRLGATFFTFGRPAAAGHLVTKWDRLFAALMASCLAHMLFMLLPPPGADAKLSSAAPVLGRSVPPGTLDVQFKQVGELPPAPRAGAALSAASHPGATSQKASQPPRGADLFRFQADAFRTTDQLTRHPRPSVKPVFGLPHSAFAPGKVILKVWIDAAGNVLAVDVEESSVPEPLSESAAAAFRGISFVPGEIDGMRVATLMRIEVTYADGVTFSYGKKSATH